MQVSLIAFVVYQTALLQRQSRYIRSTVPENAEKEAQSLFVTEVVLKLHETVCSDNIVPDLFFFSFVYHLKQTEK